MRRNTQFWEIHGKLLIVSKVIKVLSCANPLPRRTKTIGSQGTTSKIKR